MRRRGLRTVVASVGVALVLAACSTGPASAGRTGPRLHANGTTHFNHVLVVVMENLSYSTALSTPGLDALARRFAFASDAYGVSHPSLPNYLALTGGSTFGVNSDCTSCYVSANNLGEQLSRAHVRWDDFSEGLPNKCYLGASAGEYAGKHNPFRYYDDIRGSFAMCDHLLGLTPLLGDLKTPSKVPSFSFVTPNLCHDGHDCAPSVAASWLSGFLTAVTKSPVWGQKTLVIVTWDESYDSDTSSISPKGAISRTGGGGHILVLFCAKGIPKGADVTSPLNQEALLAMVERNFSLPLLAGAAAWKGHTPALP